VNASSVDAVAYKKFMYFKHVMRGSAGDGDGGSSGGNETESCSKETVVG